MDGERDQVVRQIEIAAVIDVTVNVEHAERGGARDGTDPRISCLRKPFPDGGGERKSVSGVHFPDFDSVLIRENEPPALCVDQHPERAACDDDIAAADDFIEAREENVHHLSRPGTDRDLLIVLRHTPDVDVLLCDDPEKSPVECFLPSHAESLRVCDGSLLKEFEQN